MLPVLFLITFSDLKNYNSFKNKKQKENFCETFIAAFLYPLYNFYMDFLRDIPRGLPQRNAG